MNGEDFVAAVFRFSEMDSLALKKIEIKFDVNLKTSGLFERERDYAVK